MLEEKLKNGIKTAIIESLNGNVITIATLEKYKSCHKTLLRNCAKASKGK